jgi:uracil-xanthine permease
MSAFGWKVVHGGKTPPPGEVVRPDERLGWGRTVGLGAQHVVAMFGATFVFPLIMGLNANVAIMFSGIATILFLLIVGGKVPSYLGTSASFVAGVAAIRAQGGDSSDVTGAILVCGLVLAAVGLFVHFAGARMVTRVLPPAVTGAVVMLIGFNLAPVVANVYWPQDQWIALATATFVIVAAVLFRGFWSRIAIFLGLVFGYALSYLADLFGPITSVLPGQNTLDADGNPCFPEGLNCAATAFSHDRLAFDSIRAADWVGLPDSTFVNADGMEVAGFHAPTFSLTFILLVLPGVIALIAENAGHVKAVAEMTGDDLDPYLGRALLGDGLGTALASAFGGSPTTTYAENIGVMAATRVYSTAAYYVAAVVAILLGLVPKFGALVNSIPGGVLGGITVVLYGMIGLLGAKIWVENRVDFGNPINLVPLAAGIIVGVGNVTLNVTDDFQLAGIALGTIMVIVYYHLVRAFGANIYTEPQAGGRAYEGGTMFATGNVETSTGEHSPFESDETSPGEHPHSHRRQDRE